MYNTGKFKENTQVYCILDNKIHTIKSNCSIHGYELVGENGFFKENTLMEVTKDILKKNCKLFTKGQRVVIKNGKPDIIYKIKEIEDEELHRYIIINENSDTPVDIIEWGWNLQPYFKFKRGDHVILKNGDDRIYIVKNEVGTSSYRLIDGYGSNTIEKEENLILQSEALTEKNKKEELNLIELLNGFENYEFYNPLVGKIRYKGYSDGFLHFYYGSAGIHILPNGKDEDGNLCIFPSKEIRDWKKWIQNNKKRCCPKIWGDIETSNEFFGIKNSDPYCNMEQALKKLLLLIDKGYGGIVSKSDWFITNKEKYIIVPLDNGELEIRGVHSIRNYSHIAFYSYELANEFLQYKENQNLIKEFLFK